MQSEDDFSLSGIALTALYFDVKSRLLVSGDQNGTVNASADRFCQIQSIFWCIGNCIGVFTLYMICRFASLNLNPNHMPQKTLSCHAQVLLSA